MVERQGTGRGGILKGTVDDITLHHYGACDIYREFSDAVYVTLPVTVICSTQTTAPTPCTANHVSALLRLVALATCYGCKKVNGGEWVL